MKIPAILIFTILVQKCSTNNLSIHGTWTSVKDEHYVIKFTGNKFYEIYKNDISSYSYSRSSRSCDEKYLKKTDPSLDFISIDDGRCFEITGITDSTLAYRQTVSGRLNVFYKQKVKKKSQAPLQTGKNIMVTESETPDSGIPVACYRSHVFNQLPTYYYPLTTQWQCTASPAAVGNTGLIKGIPRFMPRRMRITAIRAMMKGVACCTFLRRVSPAVDPK